MNPCMHWLTSQCTRQEGSRAFFHKPLSFSSGLILTYIELVPFLLVTSTLSEPEISAMYLQFSTFQKYLDMISIS